MKLEHHDMLVTMTVNYTNLFQWWLEKSLRQQFGKVFETWDVAIDDNVVDVGVEVGVHEDK